MLLDEREPRQRRRGDDDLEVVAASGAVDHVELGGIRECALEQQAKRLGLEWLGAHASIVAWRGVAAAQRGIWAETATATLPSPRGCGGIGRRARFRSVCP